jgi:hypothetical protein
LDQQLQAADTLGDLAVVSVRFGSGTGPLDISGAGTPEGVVTAPIGSTFRRTDGSTNTTIYRKESGAGNTGWVAVSNAGGGGSGLTFQETSRLMAIAGA